MKYPMWIPNLLKLIVSLWSKVGNACLSQINIDLVDSHAEEGMDIFGNDLDTCRIYINITKSSILGYQFFNMVSLSSYYNHTSTSLYVYIVFSSSTLLL